MSKKTRPRTFTIMKSKKRKARLRIGLAPVLIFIAFCLIAMVTGIWINQRYYEIAKNRLRPSVELPVFTQPDTR